MEVPRYVIPEILQKKKNPHLLAIRRHARNGAGKTFYAPRVPPLEDLQHSPDAPDGTETGDV